MHSYKIGTLGTPVCLQVEQRDRMMTDTHEHKKARLVSAEERHARRAFRNAMSAGLKRTYDRVSEKSVPDEFLQLLQAADRKAKA